MAEVLLVEDHDDTREMVAELLRGEGYEVLEAEHGKQALDLITDRGDHPPDLVLLDMAMPVMGGGELLEILHQRGLLETLPVVVLSASTKASDAALARAFFRKPPAMDELLETVRTFCAHAS